jgi:hypothetical protein
LPLRPSTSEATPWPSALAALARSNTPAAQPSPKNASASASSPDTSQQQHNEQERAS